MGSQLNIPSFRECCGELQEAVRAALSAGVGSAEALYPLAERVCRTARSTWSSYLDEAMAASRTGDFREDPAVLTLLTQSGDWLAAVADAAAEADEPMRSRLPKFAVSVGRRRDLVQLLHEHGLDAVEAELKKLARELPGA